MPRYYFNIIEVDETTTPVEEGMVWPDDRTAIEYAHEAARDLPGVFVKNAEVINGQHIEVVRDGTRIARVYLRQD